MKVWTCGACRLWSRVGSKARGRRLGRLTRMHVKGQEEMDMSRKALLGLVCVLAVALPATVAKARDLNPAPWDPNLPNQTWQIWEATATSSATYQVADPYTNPYYDPNNTYSLPPHISMTHAQVVQEYGPDGPPVWTWHFGEQIVTGGDTIDGTLGIYIPNNPDQNLYKQIFWQITADQPLSPVPPTTTPPGTVLPAPYVNAQHNGTWYTYNGLIQIEPNPSSEWINFEVPYSTNIEEIVVKTVCIPEPVTMGVLACGALALLRRRR